MSITRYAAWLIWAFSASRCFVAACGVLVSVVVLSSRSAANAADPADEVAEPLAAGVRPVAVAGGRWLSSVWYANVHHQASTRRLGDAGRTMACCCGSAWSSWARAAQSLKTPIEVAGKANPVGLLRADRLLIVDLLLAAMVLRAVDINNAGSYLGGGTWSIHVTPDAIELTAASDVIRLTRDEVLLIAVRPVGSCWSCYAVHALLRPGLTASAEAKDTWLPLFWVPGYTARVPRALVSALAGFSGHRLEPRLATWLGRQRLAEYQASGIVEVGTISASLGRRILVGTPAVLVLTALFALVGWTGWAALAGITGVVLIIMGLRRLRLRSAREKLPPGPWSLHVHADAIEITRAGRSLRLTAEDIESIEFHPVRRNSSCTAVYARLRSETAARLGAPDGWFPLYWLPAFSTGIPAELAVSLAVFASGRLNGSLRRNAARARNPKAPVYRRSRAYRLFR